MGFSTQLQNNIWNICAVTRTRFACVQRHKKKIYIYIIIIIHSTSGLAVNEDGPGLSEEVPPGIPSMPGRPVLIATASSSTGVSVIGGPDPVCRLSAFLRLALQKKGLFKCRSDKYGMKI